MDDEPRLSSALRRFRDFSETIRCDRRGVGASDPSTPESPPTLEQWLDDAVAVLDATGHDEAVVLGERGGAVIALALAALRADRVTGLVIVNGFAKFGASADHPFGADPAFVATVRERLFDVGHADGPFDIVGLLAPSAADDVRFREWWDRAGRQGASPATARALRGVIEMLDVRDLLPTITAPTLVLHREDVVLPRIEQGQLIADGVSSARFVSLPGNDAIWFVGDTDAVLAEIESFVTQGSPRPRDSAAEARTVLLTTSSIRRSRHPRSAIRWVEAAFRRIRIRRVSSGRRFGGTYVKSTADGSLAHFDGPLRAVQCAVALHREAETLGLCLRSGLHTGTIEHRGRDIAGITIHISARVLGVAEPNEVLITKSTAELLVGSTLDLRDRGEHVLRGLPTTLQLFEVSGM